MRLHPPTRLTKFLGAAVLLLGPVLCAADSSAVAESERKFKSGDFAGAITTLKQAVADDPSNAAAFYWLGRNYYEIRDYDNASAMEEKAVALSPKNSVYHQWLGRAYGGKADRDRSFFLAKKVKAQFQEAVKLDPSNIEARMDLEEYCYSAPWIVGGSKDEAQAQVEAIAALDPVQGHLARAMYASEALKKPAEAEAEYRAVLNAKPKDLDPYFSVANFFIHQNKPADVATAISAAAQVSPSDPRLAFYRGVSGVLSGQDAAAAERNLKAYLASAPDRSDWPSHASAREWLGRVYESQGDVADAAEQYRAALRLNPNMREARDRLKKLGKDIQ